MMITNEQVEEIKNGFFRSIVVGREYDGDGGCIVTVAGEIAADLLEARELIREYHKIGKEVVAWNVSYIPLIELLEKTKEYA